MKIPRQIRENATLAAVGLLIGGSMVLGIHSRDAKELSEPHDDNGGVVASPPTLSSGVKDVANYSASPTTSQRRVHSVQQGDTLIEILTSAGVTAAEAIGASNTVGTEFDLRKLRPGQLIIVELGEVKTSNSERMLAGLEFMGEKDKKIVLSKDDEGSFGVKTLAVAHSEDLVVKSGAIGSSFFDSARAEKVPVAIISQSFGALRHVIDFQREFRKGDMFELVYSEFDDGAPYGQHAGQLLSISMGMQNKALQFWRYTTTDGYTDYFDERGASVSKSLMKTPIDGARLSSRYGNRKHPVLGYTRMHRGLDFAAPEGTPILAAGDGVVEQRQPNGTYGNYVEIAHDTEFSSAYGHLVSFADGISPGVQVRQAQVIGFVGSTGLATGPNLHFEILRNGRQVNPLGVQMPPRRVLTGRELVRFRSSFASMRLQSQGAAPEVYQQSR